MKPISSGSRPKFSRRFLYNTTIGEDYVKCTVAASIHPSRIKKVYEYGQEIIPQCGTYGDSDIANREIFLFTTDFCYVKDVETDPQVVDRAQTSAYFPHCENFVDTVS
jgi:hypothetical protein